MSSSFCDDLQASGMRMPVGSRKSTLMPSLVGSSGGKTDIFHCRPEVASAVLLFSAMTVISCCACALSFKFKIGNSK